MKLPNADHLRVDREKVTEYLLSATHPDGHSKAEFFTRFGFCLKHWELLADALREHGATNPVVTAVEKRHGTRHLIDGRLVLRPIPVTLCYEQFGPLRRVKPALG